MSHWKWIFGLFLLLLWAALGAWVLFGGSPSEQAAAIVRSILPDYVAAEKPRSYVELTAIYPEPIALFLYTFEKYRLIYLGIALFGILMLGFAIRRAIAIARQIPEPPVSEADFSRRPQGVRARLQAGAFLVKQSIAELQTRSQSLVWRMIITLTGTIIAAGLLILLVVYSSMSGALKEQVEARVLTIVINLSVGAAAPVMKKDLAALDALAARYASLGDIAYVSIQDSEGKILAYAATDPPPSFYGSRKDRNALIFRGVEVVETQAPIPDGNFASVRVGVWRAALDQASSATFLPLAAIVLIVTAAAVLSFLLVRKVTDEIIRLARLANYIRRGNFDVPVEATSNDELGDLALDLERMRSSLKASMDFIQQLQSEQKRRGR